MSDSFDVIIIGGGQAGLAMGYFLRQQRRRFVILERAPTLGHVWRVRYDSLVLFTPAQYSGLPGMPFPAPHDHYPTKDEVVEYLGHYAARFDLPVRLNCAVQALEADEGGFRVVTDEGALRAAQVVVATGPYQRPYTPPLAANLDPAIRQLHSAAYRNPAQLLPGEALVVGAGNSGAQIAEELAATRRVTLSQGKPAPNVPQRILGRDVFWWIHALRLPNIAAHTALGRRMSRNSPLIGANLRRLARQKGVRLVGRVVGAEGRAVRLSDGQTLQVPNIIWATGFRLDLGWIKAPIFDEQGEPMHRHGVTVAPGLYFLGLHWQSRLTSATLGGVGRDAAFIAEQIARHTAKGTKVHEDGS